MVNIGKILAFIGITVIIINQYLDLITKLKIANVYTFFGVGLIIFIVGVFADEIIVRR